MRNIRTSGLQFLLALVLALALWTFVSFTNNPPREDSFEVLVELAEPSAGLLIVDPTTGLPISPTVTTVVQVSGPEIDVNSLSEENFRATADLSGLGQGPHAVPIDVDGPAGVRIRSYRPEQLNIALEPRASREFTAEAQPQGRVPFLFDTRTPVISERQITVSGPAPLVERVTRVVVPIDLNGRTSTFTEQRELVALDRDGQPVPGVALAPARTAVRVAVQPRVEVQRISVTPQITGQPAPGYRSDRIDWNPKYVEVIAQVEITGTLRTEEIDLTGRTETFTATVELDEVDDSITLLSSGPVTVTIPIVPFELPYNSSVFVPVTPTNLGTGLVATLQPPGLTITVSGTTEQFRQLETTTLQAIVDLRGLGAGSYDNLPVQVELPPGLQIIGDQPQVDVTITAPATPTPGG